MSAWLVSESHIQLLVNAASAGSFGGVRLALDEEALQEGRLEPGEAWVKVTDLPPTLLGQTLWEENRDSVAYRYNGREETGDPVTYCAGPTLVADPVTILKQIDVYEYQACEHPHWDESVAKAFCEALRKDVVTRLTGYDAAPWGWDR